MRSANILSYRIFAFERSNDAADYPVLVLTVSDPGLDAPLVAVSFKPDSTPTAQALGVLPGS